MSAPQDEKKADGAAKPSGDGDLDAVTSRINSLMGEGKSEGAGQKEDAAASTTAASEPKAPAPSTTAATSSTDTGSATAAKEGDKKESAPGSPQQGKASQLLESTYDVTVTLADQQADPDSPLYSVKSFDQLGLTEELLKGIYAMKYQKPSKIQERALPLLLQNPPKNMIGQSQSGTGKTAAFVLTMLSRVDFSINAPQAIALAREFVGGNRGGCWISRMLTLSTAPFDSLTRACTPDYGRCTGDGQVHISQDCLRDPRCSCSRYQD